MHHQIAMFIGIFFVEQVSGLLMDSEMVRWTHNTTVLLRQFSLMDSEMYFIQ